MRILVIEDNAELARQIKSTLEHAMYVEIGRASCRERV